jgi:hypothetical protein
VLSFPRFEEEFHLFVDASSLALAAVLNHKVNGDFIPVAFASKALLDHERKFSTYELECMAICWGVEKFNVYLQVKPFHLYTDNGALSWLFSHPKQLGKLGRMVLKLSSYKFTIHHVRGTVNNVADCLSRVVPVPSENVDRDIDLSKVGDDLLPPMSCVLNNIPL